MHLVIIAVLSFWSLLVSASVIQIDDRDPSITYSPPNAWTLGGTANEINGTTTWTVVPFANFSFTFTGIGIEVVGTLDIPSTGGYSYYIDDGEEQSVAGRGGFQEYGVSLAQIENLPNKEHTFVLKNGGPANTNFILDAIRFTTDTPTSAGSGNSTSAGPDGSIPTGSSSSTSSNSNVGALVGGLVGGLFFGALLAITALLFYRRRRRQASQQPTLPIVSGLTPDPYPHQQISSSTVIPHVNADSLPPSAPPTYMASMLTPVPYPNQQPSSVSLTSRTNKSVTLLHGTPPPEQPPLLSSHGNRKERLSPPPPAIRSSPKRENWKI